MARDSNGDYSLYTPGNPVVSGTTISSSWANNTLTDVATAMTDSLARSGQGGMLAALKLFAGTQGAPGLSWTAETTSGLYRAGAGDFRWAIGGADIFTITGSGLSIGFANGTAAAPSVFFTSDTDTGLYRVAADTLGVTIGGTVRLTASTTVLTSTLLNQGPAGTAAAPSISFSGDADTGLYSVGADSLGITLGGTVRLTASTATLTSTLLLLNPAGTAAAPSFSFSADTNTGIYSISDDVIGISTGGALRFAVTNTVAQCQDGVQFQVYDGSAAAPSYAFSGDTDTGMYRLGTNRMGFASAGAVILAIDSDLTFGSNVTIRGQDGTSSNPFYSFDSDTNTGIYRSATDRLSISAGGTTRANFDASFASIDTPLFRATGIHNGTSPTGASDQYIASGTYTPTISSTTNIDSTTPNTTHWIRVGNVVYVCGTLAVDCTAAAFSQFSMSLPLASNLAGGSSLQGQAHHRSGPPFVLVSIIEGSVSDVAIFQWTAAATTSIDMPFMFSYLML